MDLTPFSERAIAVIRAIPRGRVATYGQVAALAGNRHAARQIARLLHAASRTRRLPWHRVVNRRGRISLPGPDGDRQRRRLEAEGVAFDAGGRIDLAVHQWRPAPGSPGPAHV